MYVSSILMCVWPPWPNRVQRLNKNVLHVLTYEDAWSLEAPPTRRLWPPPLDGCGPAPPPRGRVWSRQGSPIFWGRVTYNRVWLVVWFWCGGRGKRANIYNGTLRLEHKDRVCVQYHWWWRTSFTCCVGGTDGHEEESDERVKTVNQF